MNISTDELYRIYKQYPKITTDSRFIPDKSLFFALKGENFDGNKFAEEAVAKGAAFAVIDDKKYLKDERFLLTEDVLAALQELAKFHRKQLKTIVIGITGTNGKTTTKELIARVLNSNFKTKATIGNLNNHIGVPLTLLSLSGTEKFAVVEMGANHTGEIKQLCDIALPDFGIITNIGKAHLEGFGTFEGVIKTKGELYDFLRKANGKVFLNSDNKILSEISSGLKTITYGTGKDNYCTGELIGTTPFLRIRYNSANINDIINTKLYGSYNFENILAAITIGTYFEVRKEDIKSAIESYEPANNRSQILETKNNTVIMDAYNANPTSMIAAIDSFAKSDYNNKMVILGDMLELGKESRSEHIKIIKKIGNTGIPDIILVGPIFKEVAESHGYKCFKNSAETANYLKENPVSTKTILLKASRGIHLETIVKYL